MGITDATGAVLPAPARPALAESITALLQGPGA